MWHHPSIIVKIRARLRTSSPRTGGGHRRDVTWLTQFASSDSGVLDVSASGSMKAIRNGESVVRATFRDQVEIATVTTPYSSEFGSV